VASAETGAAIEVETRIAASPETVFEFFTDPDKMIQWMGRSAQLDPRVGGGFRCDINGRDVARGEYVEVDPRPRRGQVARAEADNRASIRRQRPKEDRPMGNPTMWFEVAGKDHQALKDFYSQLFEWKLTDMDGMPYSTIDTGGEGIPGGVGAAPEGHPGHVTF